MKSTKKKNLNSVMSSLLCVLLIAAMTLIGAGCKDNKNEAPATSASETSGTPETSAKPETSEAPETDDASDTADVTSDAASESTDTNGAEATVLGEGEKQFSFNVVDADGNETAFVINTDAKTVGEALVALNLVEGEESTYGLYVKTVNGITADYDTDGTYWAFYINGEYAMTGVDSTDVTSGFAYTFKVEK